MFDNAMQSLDTICDIELSDMDDSLLELDDIKTEAGSEHDELNGLIFSNSTEKTKRPPALTKTSKRKKPVSSRSGEEQKRKKSRKSSSASSSKGKNKEDKVPYIPWNEVEDQKLKNIVQRKIAELQTDEIREPDNTNTFPWGNIALRMSGRTPKQCRERWRNKLNPTIKQTPWTIEEDITLMDMHRRLGNRWVLLASLLPGRTENSVKTRFKSIVRARRRSWRREEDEKLLSVYNQVGGKWAQIAEKLPNRTANGVKVRLRQIMGGEVQKVPELGSPFQSFGVEMPEIIAKNELFLKEYLQKEAEGNDIGRRSLRTMVHSDDNSEDDRNMIEPPSPSRTSTYDPLVDTIHPRGHKTQTNVSSKKKLKGTRALIMDRLQKNADTSIPKKMSSDFGSFASTIATILKPSDSCNTEAAFDLMPHLKHENVGIVRV